MKKINFLLFLFGFSFILNSCTNSENKSRLAGEWQGVKWLVGGNPSNYDVKQVHFKFAMDGGYSSDFGGDKEKGTYIVRDDKLYTTPDDQLEIMVKIAELTKDTLVFDMNRSGQAEILTLIRK